MKRSRDLVCTSVNEWVGDATALLVLCGSIMFATTARQMSAPTPFSELHRKFVMDLYRRYLRDSLNWHIRRDAWRQDAIRIRAEFEFHRHIRNPRELASILHRAEQQLEHRKHPDPYKRTYSLCSNRATNICQPPRTSVVLSGTYQMRHGSAVR